MYDDAVPNLESFVELKDEYPHTKFYAWHVSLEGEASEYHRTNEAMLPASTFTGSKKNKLGPKGQLKATDAHAKAGKLVGGT